MKYEVGDRVVINNRSLHDDLRGVRATVTTAPHLYEGVREGYWLELDPGHKWTCDVIHMPIDTLTGEELWDAQQLLDDPKDGLMLGYVRRGAENMDLREANAELIRQRDAALIEARDARETLARFAREADDLEEKYRDSKETRNSQRVMLTAYRQHLDAWERTGEAPIIRRVESTSEPGIFHEVVYASDGTLMGCDCLGWVFHGHCKHPGLAAWFQPIFEGPSFTRLTRKDADDVNALLYSLRDLLNDKLS